MAKLRGKYKIYSTGMSDSGNRYVMHEGNAITVDGRGMNGVKHVIRSEKNSHFDMNNGNERWGHKSKYKLGTITSSGTMHAHAAKGSRASKMGMFKASRLKVSGLGRKVASARSGGGSTG